MRLLRILCATALLASSTGAWAQPAYCDKTLCKAWTGPGWYVVYGGYFSKQMLKAGPLADQECCKAEAAKLARKSSATGPNPTPEGRVEVVEAEYFCLLLESGEKAARDYMIPA